MTCRGRQSGLHRADPEADFRFLPGPPTHMKLKGLGFRVEGLASGLGLRVESR